MIRSLGLLLWLAGLAACAKPVEAPPAPLPQISAAAGTAAARINGNVGAPEATPPARYSLAPAASAELPPGQAAYAAAGNVSLDFADTDIRAAVAQILGNILHVNYTIDPGVHGTATLRTVQPLTRSQLLAVLQTLLAQNGATMVVSGDVYRVLPTRDAATVSAVATTAAEAGVAVVPLRYTSAPELALLLRPFVANGGRIVAEQGSNALVVSGDPPTRDTLVQLVRAFDIDILAGQSYALLPVTSGDAKDFASSLQDAFRSQTHGPLADLVKVVPMPRINSVLVVASQPALIEDVQRVYALIQRKQRETVRSWHVYYLQDSRANDVAYMLQQAFTPNNVTAQPSSNGRTAGYGTSTGLSSIGLSGTVGGGLLGAGAGGLGGGIGTPGLGGTLGGGIGTAGTAGAPGAAAGAPAASAPNPLLGGLEQAAGGEPTAMHIIPDTQNNAVLIYATAQEEDTVEAMLRKIDILPLQVRIDAIIAEVDLNDALQYGTQFFFNQGGLNGVLAQTFPGVTTGFRLVGNPNSAQLALAALQGVTKVRVLSSPEIMVLDNQPAQLQVGDLVPYLSQTSQSTIASNAPIVNSVNYMQTGVITQVTPRVNSGGLVTLDIVQVVSNVDSSITTQVNSPAFLERTVQSSVVVEDGQTVGLAGLIQDSATQTNQGFPWIKDIPLIGGLFGQQNNSRMRTELLVLITPHVIHDQRDARALTDDLRDQMRNAAVVPQQLQNLKASGSPDPNELLRQNLGLH